LGKKIAILGAGSWGTALAIHLAAKGEKIKLWVRSSENARQLSETRENKKYLPGVLLSPCIEISSDLGLALKDAEIIVLAVPSRSIREVTGRIRPLIRPGCYLVNTAKGLENKSCLRLSEVISQELPEFAERLAVLSGPSHAEEVCRGMPTAVVVAARSQKIAEFIQDVFMTSSFRVYTNSDVVGVELGGALKNIIALGTGIAEGLGFGDNTRAALITRGLTEIACLGVVLGANPLTFLGLAGVGDLVVTATSMHSRNRRAGIFLGQGLALKEVLQKVGMVVEGIETTSAARKLSFRYGIEMPITEQIYQVLFSKLPPQTAVSNLMLRSRRHEVKDIFLNCLGWGK